MNIATRLRKLEQHTGAEAVVLAVVDGKTLEMTLDEYLKSDNARFVRFSRLERLKDLDKFLDCAVGGVI